MINNKMQKTWQRRIAAWVVRGSLLLLILSVSLVLALRYLPPPTSAFMLADALERRAQGRSPALPIYKWVDWEGISPNVALAVIAAEDQKFAQHGGFDWQAIAAAWRFNQAGSAGAVRGASTLSQQVAKNLFLWRGRSWVRKGLEAYWTLLIEWLWPKRRILEVYLNVAEFGDGIYGVEAAARRYWGKPARHLNAEESSYLAAVLPNPLRYRADQPSPWVRERARWIRMQMRQLGQKPLQAVGTRAGDRPPKE